MEMHGVGAVAASLIEMIVVLTIIEIYEPYTSNLNPSDVAAELGSTLRVGRDLAHHPCFDWACSCAAITVFVHLLTHTNTYMHAYINTYIRACMHTCIHAYMHTYTRHACVHACMHAYMQACKTCIHAYGIHTCMQIHAYMHTCIHSYIRTHGPCNNGIHTFAVCYDGRT